MRLLPLASAALLCVSGAAFAQNSASPLSGKASNVSGATTRRAMAPRFATPGGDDPDTLLRSAQSALSRGRTGEAQEALERAETRLLDRSEPAADANTPISGPRIDAIRQALSSLGSGDRAGAKAAIATAMNQPATDTGAMGTNAMGTGPMGAPGSLSGIPAAGRGVNPTTIQPPGGPTVAPAKGPYATSPVNPAGLTGGGNAQSTP